MALSRAINDALNPDLWHQNSASFSESIILSERLFYIRQKNNNLNFVFPFIFAVFIVFNFYRVPL